ncbi:MAG: hypothetical protein ACLFU3_04505 [Dichotomicrobium sp.]
MLRRTFLLRRNIHVPIVEKVYCSTFGMVTVFWLWPWMEMGTMMAAPALEGGSGYSSPRLGAAVRPSRKPETAPDAFVSSMQDASHEWLLHVTTTLSRTWQGMSRLFARVRDAIAYERWMHATFGWALSPIQRLLPSAVWPMVHTRPGQSYLPERGIDPVEAGQIFAMGFAWGRGCSSAPRWHNHVGWMPLPPAPPKAPAWQSGGAPGQLAAMMFAPILGVTLGLQGLFPAAGFGTSG